MIRPILRYGADTLHGTASEVQRFDDDLQRLIDDMVDTCLLYTSDAADE